LPHRKDGPNPNLGPHRRRRNLRNYPDPVSAAIFGGTTRDRCWIDRVRRKSEKRAAFSYIWALIALAAPVSNRKAEATAAGDPDEKINFLVKIDADQPTVGVAGYFSPVSLAHGGTVRTLS
jgi:hypothetical protein